jgi:hypothetical protein
MSILVISMLGPDLPGQMVLISCIVRHYIDESHTWIQRGRNVTLEYNGLSVAHFALRILFGGGLIYVPHLIKILMYQAFMSYLNFGYGALIILLNNLCHLYEKSGEMETLKFLFVRALLKFIKSFRALTTRFTFFLVATNVFGVILGLLVEVVTSPFKKGGILQTSEEIEDWTRSIWGQHLIPHWKWFLVQALVFAVYTYLTCKYKELRFQANDNDKWTKERRKPVDQQCAEYRQYVDKFNKWRLINWGLKIASWSLPFIGLLPKYLAPEWLNSFETLGNLAAGESGINYWWGMLDLHTLPAWRFTVYE